MSNEQPGRPLLFAVNPPRTFRRARRFPIFVTRQSPLLAFESSAFAIIPGEDTHTRPGIYGKALAQWLAERLRAAGVGVGDIVADGFGWCVLVESKRHALYVACANAGERPDCWRVFALAECGLLTYWLGRDTSGESVAFLFGVVRQCLESA